MTKLIKLDDIVILENRQRRDFDPQRCEELKTSIETTSLLHPIVLRDYLDQKVLVAGETRLRCMQDIWALGGTFKHDGKPVQEGMVPYVNLGELSPLEAEEAELDENLRRKDLTWQEHAGAVQRLHELRVKQSTVLTSTTITSASDPDFNERILTTQVSHTVADTAKELHGRSDGYFQDSVRKELIVAKHLSSNPSIAKAKNVDEAFKLLKREEEAKRNAALAVSVGATFSAASHTAVQGGCLEWMANPDNQGRFDVICTDPPYGMGADQFGDGGGKLAGIEHHYDDSYDAWKTLMWQWTKLSFLVAKPQAHAYVFCDIDHFHELKVMMQTAGWYVFRTPMIVYKMNSGRVPLPDRGPRRQYEIILYAIKGDKPVTHIYPDVIPSQADDNMSHGAQKPVMVFQNLLQRSVRPGDAVLDCFSGSGTIFPACHTLKCRATGIEVQPEYYGMGLKRLQELDGNEGEAK